MKDVAPRIFRSLEAARGHAPFDAIVAAAVAAYGSLRSPNAAQALEFGRLVAPLWGQTKPETRRSLAAALSHAVRVPAEIVELLVNAPVEISAPFLVSSPTLNQAHLDRLAARGDDRLDKIVAGRAQRGLEPARPLQTETARSTVLPSIPSPPLAADDLGSPRRTDEGEAASFVRETLREIALAGARDSRSPGAVLLRAARPAHAPSFFDTLQSRLELTVAERAAAEADESGYELASRLRSAGVETGQALAILMLIRPRIGLDVEAFRAMASHYRGLPAPSVRPVRPRPARFEDGVREATGRPAAPFGRRKEALQDERKRSKS